MSSYSDDIALEPCNANDEPDVPLSDRINEWVTNVAGMVKETCYCSNL